MRPYYTDRQVKGSGTGGQFNPQARKSRVALDWIISQRPGTRIRRSDVRGSVTCSNHVADGALHEAEKVGLVSAAPRVRTRAVWQPWREEHG